MTIKIETLYGENIYAGSIPKARRQIVARLGDDVRVRISRDGYIHVLGIMPNTTERGWYIYGDWSRR